MNESVVNKIYRPMKNVGQVYARAYGNPLLLPVPIGNVLEFSIEQTEDAQSQDDMTVLGGGMHSESRRIKDVKIKLKIADLNVVNLTRAMHGTVQTTNSGTVANEQRIAQLGGLVRLTHLQPTELILKKGTTSAAATTIPAAGNYEVRPEGVYLLPGAAGIANEDLLWLSYSYQEYASIEAMTTRSVELELTVGGMNEADSGNPVLTEIWRASQGITKSLALINKSFGALDIEGSVLMDPTKTGVGISRYYKTSLA